MTAPLSDAEFLESCRQAEAAAREMLDPNAPVPLGWIAQGVRHGYPGCCILFFCTVWRAWLNQQVEHGDATADQYKRILEREGWPTDGYIPCPTCVARRAGLDAGHGRGWRS